MSLHESIERDHKMSNDEMTLREAMLVHVQKILNVCKGNKEQASKRLGISRSTLYRYIEQIKKVANESL